MSGEKISVNLDQELLNEGYKIKRIINYRVNHNKNFSEQFVKELKKICQIWSIFILKIAHIVF